MRPLLLCLLLMLAAIPSAQAQDPTMQSLRQLYEAGKQYVTATAEQSPEADFAYRPVATVRTLGQILGHLADAHFMICSLALGEGNPNGGSVEQAVLGRSELIEVLRRSYAYCDRAYAQDSAALAASTELFGEQTTRLHALNVNVSHDFEHYGNLATYVRMRDRVPPSSQPAP